MMKIHLNNLSNKLNKIKLVVMDFDGIFTDGSIYLREDSNGFRKFDVKDGMGIKLLQKISIKLAVISGSNSEIIKIRAQQLGIEIIEKNVENKLLTLEKIQKKLNFNKIDTLFLGDDVNDLSVIPNVNLFFVPADAHLSCKKKADYIGKRRGGKGFIREVADKILINKGYNPNEIFLTRNEFSN